MTLYFYGDKYLPNKNITDGVWCVNPMANELGFETGDKFLTADGEEIERFSDVLEKIILAEAIVVDRNGNTTNIQMPKNIIERFLNNEKQLLFYPRVPSIVSGLTEGSNAEKAGLKEGDVLIGVNNSPIKYHDELKSELIKNKGENVLLLVDRGGDKVSLTARVNQNGTLGFISAIPSLEQLEQLNYYSLASEEYTFLASLPAGYKKAIKKLGGYIDQFMLILTPSTGAYKGLGGFGAIGSLFPAKWNWEVFWNLTAFLSLMLAFMNILPIPALDGGHVMFLLYEMVVGKPAPEKVIESAQIVGMILLLSLLVFANGNDILRLFKVEALSEYHLIIIFSVTIIVSYFFTLYAKKTGVPAVLLLIFLGIIINYSLRFSGFTKPDLLPVLGVLGVVGLILIVLEAALDLELVKDKIALILKSFLIALIGLVATSYLSALCLTFLMGVELTSALLCTIPLSILGSAVILPSVDDVEKEKREFIIYESTFSDIIGIVAFYTVLTIAGSSSSEGLSF